MNQTETPDVRADILARRFISGKIDRRQLLKGTAVVGGSALLTSVLAACGASPSAVSTTGAVGKPVSGGTLTAALTGNPNSLDPIVPGVVTSLQVFDNIFDRLIELDHTGRFVPGLAKSWKQNDSLTYTFDLVSNATFHNGEKFTADDVKYTIERIQDPKTAATYASSFSPISSVEVTSPTQVVFHLSTPFAPLLTNLASFGEIVNQKAIETLDPTRQPVGTGPYVFKEWVQGDHITLTKNPSYFMAGKPHLDEVIFKFLDVDQSRIVGLQSGQLDWLDAVPLNQLASLKKNPAYTYVTSEGAGLPDFIAFNTSKAPFNNKALRQAIAAAIDRTEILEIAYFGAGEKGYMEVPSQSPWYGGTPPYQKGPDLAVARKKLAEAGYPKGLTVTIMALPQYPELLKTAEILKSQLAKIGITVNLDQVEVTVWFTRYVGADYEMTTAYDNAIIDPDQFFSTEIKSGGGNNDTRYSNPKVDKMIDAARAETDQKKRLTMYEKIREIIWDDVPMVFVHYETLNYLMRKDVYGSEVIATEDVDVADMWKTK